MRAGLFFVLGACLSTPPAPAGRGHEWTEVSSANQPGKLHSVDMVFDETRKRVVLHGGIDLAEGALSATWELTDGNAWVQICGATSPPPLYAPALSYDPDGERLVLVGGSLTPDLMQPVNTIWTCDSKTAAGWVMSGTLPIAVAGAQLVQDRGRDGQILVGGMEDRRANTYSSADLVNWEVLNDAAPTPFGGLATNVTYDRTNDRVLALKNYTRPYGESPEATNEIWALEKDVDRWTLVCHIPARAEAALVHLGDAGSTYLIGGRGTGGEIAGAWVLDNDELVKTHDDPPARDYAAAAYDGDRNIVVVYGGNGPGCAGNCGSTWIMSGE